MRPRLLLLPLLPVSFLIASACAHAPVTGSPPPVVLVEADAEWRGTVRIGGVVHVRKDATLTIAPGTRIEFGPERFGIRDEHEGFFAPGIRVEGRIVAEGTKEAPIVFTPGGRTARPGEWDKILFQFSGGNRFRHCVFEGARYAFHAHFSEITVRDCLFRENEEGVRLGASRVTIEDSVFTRNEVRGINFRECRNTIRRNLVYENGDGIFLHSKDSLSVIRENAVYANRGYNLRLGDLHADDIDVSGNWWGTPSAREARKTIYDGETFPGIGTARIGPVLSLPPVSGAEVRGLFMYRMRAVAGGTVRAYSSPAAGFRGPGSVAEAVTDEYGAFHLSVPPGRYFLVGRAQSRDGKLFAFPGKNPVAVSLGETADVGLPAVVAPPPAAVSPSAGTRTSIAAKATLLGSPLIGVTVQAFRIDAPDFRGPGVASAVTNEDGIAVLYLPPETYFLAAKKRTTGAGIGMVDEGGLFGVFPESPVTLEPDTTASVEIPLFEKRGILADEGAFFSGIPPAGAVYESAALLDGKPAEGYLVYFYLPPDTIGRPAARSSPTSRSGSFRVSLPEEGEYVGYLRKAVPGLPAGAEEERIGPLPVRARGGKLHPSPLSFDEN